jgi:hypothetical protein
MRIIGRIFRAQTQKRQEKPSPFDDRRAAVSNTGSTIMAAAFLCASAAQREISLYGGAGPRDLTGHSPDCKATRSGRAGAPGGTPAVKETWMQTEYEAGRVADS